MSVPVDVLASSLSIRVPSLVDTQVKCSGSTSSRPVSAVKLPSAAVQLLALPVPVAERDKEGSHLSGHVQAQKSCAEER